MDGKAGHGERWLTGLKLIGGGVMKWEYSTHLVYLGTEGRGKNAERVWMMDGFDDGVERRLNNGLTLLGEQGWELAAIQLSGMVAGGSGTHWHNPSSIYVFKRPVPEGV